jgi:hypothetical protein
MFPAVSRVLVIVMMLTAFVGQAITFNTLMSCETSVDPLSPNFIVRVKNYDSNPIGKDNQEDCCGIECCGIDCICIANACSSFLYVNMEVVTNNIAALSEIVYTQQAEQPKSIASLLYRPPIFIS